MVTPTVPASIQLQGAPVEELFASLTGGDPLLAGLLDGALGFAATRGSRRSSG